MSNYFLAILGIMFFSGTGCTSKEDIQPNVLFISFDDLNDWTGCLSGHPQTITPNIDRLAEKGVLFTNAHCAGTMCCPSRASVITGLRPTTTGVYKNTDTPLDLYKEKQTLNRHFKENGYFVAGAGKILHKFYYEEDHWDEFVRKHDKPFFLACGIFRPHIPWFNPEKYFDLHPLDGVRLPLVQDNDLADVPLPGKNIAYSITNYTKEWDLNNTEQNIEHEKIRNDGLWKEAVRAYLASVSYADAQLGRLFDALEDSPCAGNTIIVLWSDHGWHLGEKEHWRKATLWEQVTRVPLVISAPGMVTHRECKQPASLIDIYPTLIDLCGLPEIEELEGMSLVPQLLDPDKERTLPAVTSLTPEFHAVRDLRYRYISYGNGKEELYDHDRDPEEWTNIAGDPAYSMVKDKMKKHIPQGNAQPLRGPYSK